MTRLPALVAYCVIYCIVGCADMDAGNSARRLSTEAALNYVHVYARVHRVSGLTLQVASDGSFHAHLGPLQFEYKAGSAELLVRATVLNDAVSLQGSRNDEVRAELARVAAQDTEKVDSATFEIMKLSWEPYPNPELYLRKAVDNSSMTGDQFVQFCDSLSKTAYQWHTLYFRQLVQRVRSRK